MAAGQTPVCGLGLQPRLNADPVRDTQHQ